MRFFLNELLLAIHWFFINYHLHYLTGNKNILLCGGVAAIIR